jgi:hypothetical protein
MTRFQFGKRPLDALRAVANTSLVAIYQKLVGSTYGATASPRCPAFSVE